MLARTAASLLGVGLCVGLAAGQQGLTRPATPPVLTLPGGLTTPAGQGSKDVRPAAPAAPTPAFLPVPLPREGNSVKPAKPETTLVLPTAPELEIPIPASKPATPPVTAPEVKAPTATQILQFEKPAEVPVAVPLPPLTTTAYQQPRIETMPYPDTQAADELVFDLPGPGRLFRLESEANLQERIRQRARSDPKMEKIIFPQEEPLPKQDYAPRTWVARTKAVEPSMVTHGRLYQQDLNTERYGWELGVVQPVISAGTFYAQLATTPYRWATDPFRVRESSAGYCLPGDPVPYKLYPPGVSIPGSLAEAATILALIAVFP